MNISLPAIALSSLHPPNASSPKIVTKTDPITIITVCKASVYATALNPPKTAYNPVSTITKIDPIQKLSMPKKFISGRRTLKTIPPANIPTAILVKTYATSDITDNTVLEAGENLRSRNSGMVKTFDRI